MNDNKTKQAVILCGGLGTRLKDVIKDIPKPMAPVGKLPFLDYLVSQLKQNGFNKFLFLTGYKSEVIENYFQGKEFNFSVEKMPLGTGGALFNAFAKLEDEFFMLNGDTFFDIDFNIFLAFINSKEIPVALALRATSDVSRYGLVNINDNFAVEKFVEKTSLDEKTPDGYINAGIYYFKKAFLKSYFENWNKKLLSIEKDIFPQMVNKSELFALPLGGKFIDIGIPEDYKKAQEEIPQRVCKKAKPALFIDRDGTIINDPGYIFGTDLTFFEDTVEFVRNYQEKGFYIFVVTNQSGIAKGKFSEEDSRITNNEVIRKYSSLGIKIDDLKYCPYHIYGCINKYSKNSIFRKPNPGMLLELGEKHKIDYKNSIMYGDREDIDKIKLPYINFIKKET